MLQAPVASSQPASEASVPPPLDKPGADYLAQSQALPAATAAGPAITIAAGTTGAVHALGADGALHPLGPGDHPLADDIIETGAGARVVLQLPAGPVIVAGADSRLLITGEADGQAAGQGAAPLAGRFLILVPATADGPGQPLALDTAAGAIHLQGGALLLEHARGEGVRFVLLNGALDAPARLWLANDAGSFDFAASADLVTVGGKHTPPAAGDPADCARLADSFADILPFAPAGCAAVAGAGAPAADALRTNDGPAAGGADGPFKVTAFGHQPFDLTPQPATLAEAEAALSAPGAAVITLPRHTEEALFQNMAGTEEESGPEPLPPVYLTRWDPGRRWDAIGGVDENAGSVPELPLEKTGLITARAGAMAQLEQAQRSTQELEQFLRLAPGTLAEIAPDTVPTTGSAIKSLDAIHLNAGDSVRFDVFFDAAGTLPLNDFAVFSVATGGRSAALPILSTADVGDYGASGWQTIEYKAGTAGAYTFGFAILEGGSPLAPSRLYVDHVRQVESSTFPFHAVDSQTDDLGGTLQRFVARPIALPDSFELREDQVLTLNPQDFLANDLDPDPFDALALQGIDRTGALGRVYPLGDGGIAYDPTLRFQGLADGETAADRFTYIVDGGNKVTAQGTVNLRIKGVNDAPVAVADTAAAQRGGAPVLIPVTANDTDVDSDDDGSTLRVVAASAQSGAKVTFAGTPGAGITYTPPASNALATDTITYTIEDKHGARAQASVRVTLSGSVPGPPARADSGNTDEDTRVALDVLANDGAPGDRLSIVSLDTSQTRGSVSLGAGGAITYDPRGRFDNLTASETATDRFRYTVANEAGGTTSAEVTLTIVGRNDAPVANRDTATAELGGPAIVVPVLLNDTDVDSKEGARGLKIVAAYTESGAPVSFDPGAGGALTYTPPTGGTLSRDRVVYTLADSHGAQAQGTLDITLAAGPAPVGAGADTIAATEDQPAVLAAPGLLANDTGGRPPVKVTAVNDQPVGSQPLDLTLASGGRLVVGADGAVRFDPQGRYETLAAGQTAQESLNVRVSDAKTSDTATLTITIAGRNDAPVARSDQASVGEDDTSIAISVLANDDDIDADDDATTLRLVQAQAASGSAVTFKGTAGAGISYTPAGHFDHLGAGESGSDNVTYTLSDRHGLTATGTLTVTVTGRNDAPVAADDRLNTRADAVLTLTPAIGVLANDRDADLSDRLQVVAVNGERAAVGNTVTLASGAHLRLNADGSLSYDSQGRFNGLDLFETATDRFTYTVADRSGAAAQATATIQIVNANQPPVAADDAATTDAGSSVRIAVLANDTDPEHARLSIAAVDTTGTKGQVRINPDGTVSYDPNGKFAGLRDGETARDSFRYTVDDNIGGRDEATVVVTIRGTASVLPPSELFQSFETPSGPVVAGWLRDPAAGAVPSPTALVTSGPEAAPGLVPTHLARMLKINAIGSSARGPGQAQSPVEAFLKLPGGAIPDDNGRHAGESGDGTEPAGAAAVSTRVTLGPGNLDASGRALIAFDWAFVTTERVPDNGGGRNDAAVFTVSDGTRFRVFTLADARVSPAGSAGWRTAVYDAANDFNLRGAGPVVLTLGFAVLNDESNENPSSLLLDNVRLGGTPGSGYESLPRNENDGLGIFRQRPTPAAGSPAEVAATDEDTAVSFAQSALLAGARTSTGASADSLRLVAINGQAASGKLTLADGRVTYDPNGHFEALAAGGTATDTIAFTFTDANGGIASARAQVTIEGRNDAPVAHADTAAADEGGPAIRIAVLANDTDVDTDGGVAGLRVVAASAQSGARVTFTGQPGDGIVYEPPASFTGIGAGNARSDTITYTIADRHGLTAEAVVTVNINGRNTAPIAADDTLATDENSVARFDVRANDRDNDPGDRLTVSAINGHALDAGESVSLASGAGVVLFPDGTLAYDPRQAFQSLRQGEQRTDTFIYRISDASGATADATVSVAVRGLNDAPVATLDRVQTTEDAILTLASADLLANDSDADAGDRLRLLSIDASGAVSLDGDQVIYNPQGRFDFLAAGETTKDTWTYRVADDAGVSATGTVEVTIVGVNDRPLAVEDRATTAESAAVTIDVRANDRDPDHGDQLTISGIDTSGTRGSVAIRPDGTLLYDPAGRFDTLSAGEQATDTFRYTVADRGGLSDSGLVTITITGKNTVERVVESFETDPLPAKTSSFVTAAHAYQETDGTRDLYTPTDPPGGNGRMAVLEARGHPRNEVEEFLGLPAGSLPRDSDGSFRAHGSAMKVRTSVQTGDEVSFDWMFDARDSVRAPADGNADNDLAFAVVDDGTTTRLFSLADVRDVGDKGASGWRTSVFKAASAGSIVIGFGVVNDRATEFSGPEAENSFLLVDNVRINRAFNDSYQVVSSQGGGAFETLAHPENPSS